VDNMVFHQRLGKGSFGTVYAFKDLQREDHSGAAKVISKVDVRSLDELHAFSAECNALRKVGGHPNVVKAYGFLHAKQNLYIFMEMVGTSGLCSFLQQEKEQGLPEDQVCSLFRCISNGVAHCHELKVAHCDLSCQALRPPYGSWQWVTPTVPTACRKQWQCPVTPLQGGLKLLPLLPLWWWLEGASVEPGLEHESQRRAVGVMAWIGCGGIGWMGGLWCLLCQMARRAVLAPIDGSQETGCGRGTCS